MRIQSQANQYPGTRQAATQDDPPSAHFDGDTRTVVVNGEEFELAWASPNEVEVIKDGFVIRYLEPDDEWSPDEITGWDFIEYLFETIADDLTDTP